MALADQAGAGTRSWPERVLTIGAPVVYLVALGVSIVLDGLPLARDQLFFWLVLGMAAFSVAAWRSWGMMLLEWLPLLALLVAYDFLRGAVSVPELQAHVDPQIRFDEWLTGGVVPTVWLQQHLWDPVRLHWYDYATWAVYMSHFFVVWVVAAVLWRVAHHRFRRYVALTVLVTIAALATYWLFPAQPPWLAAEHGLIAPVDRVVPTVWGALGVPTASSLWENGDLVNLVAAMPSLHASYPFMLLLFFWPVGWRARIPLAAYALAMGFALVYGGEHWVLDIFVGWLWTLLAFALVAWVWPRVRRALPSWRARSSNA
jgi:membrane-associated phospholipid phosphatase